MHRLQKSVGVSKRNPRKLARQNRSTQHPPLSALVTNKNPDSLTAALFLPNDPGGWHWGTTCNSRAVSAVNREHVKRLQRQHSRGRLVGARNPTLRNRRPIGRPLSDPPQPHLRARFPLRPHRSSGLKLLNVIDESTRGAWTSRSTEPSMHTRSKMPDSEAAEQGAHRSRPSRQRHQRRRHMFSQPRLGVRSRN